MQTKTYQEPVNRYAICRNEKLPPEHVAYYLEAGIDPDDNWSLIFSFWSEAAALEALHDLTSDPDKPEGWTYKLFDLGSPTSITRSY